MKYQPELPLGFQSSIFFHSCITLLIGTVFSLTLLLFYPADVFAQDGLQTGEAYLTRFSGTTHENGQTVIDTNGTVGSIVDIRNPSGAPQGQHWINQSQHLPITAAQAGQVFGIALDDANPPNIYLTATAAFGLHRNTDNSDWMSGMWGVGGGAGSVWKLSAASGYAPELFADITLNGRANSGASLGNIAFDKWNKQLYVSDLETGMIHRLSITDGGDLGRYDHGAQGRGTFTDATAGSSESLPAVTFNPATGAQTTGCSFGAFSSTPTCWNIADFRRRIWGLGVHRNAVTDEIRLYYSVWGSQSFGHPDWVTAGDERKNSLWSVKIGTGGNFDTASVRREFFLPDFFTDPTEVAIKGPSHPVADIAFARIDDQEIMVLAERGGIRNLGLEVDEPFSYPNESRVLSYNLDDAGNWQPEARYDVGHFEHVNAPKIRASAAGGVAFGFTYNESYSIDPASSGKFLWMTGDSLCSPEGPCFDPANGDFSDLSQVHGMQGTPVEETAEISSVDPLPADGINSSYMIDADGGGDLTRNDTTKIGDIEIYKQVRGFSDYFPGWIPPDGWLPPDDWMTPGWTPPGWEEPPGWDFPPWWPPEIWFEPDLSIDKTYLGISKVPAGGYIANFRITITNVGVTNFTGRLYANDNPPAGTSFLSIDGDAGDGDPGWTCVGAMPVACNSGAEVTLAAMGGSESILFRISIPEGFDPEAPGGILPPGAEGATSNCAHIDLAHHLDDPVGNNSDCANFDILDEPLAPGPNLSIDKTYLGLSKVPGEGFIANFRISVTNVGDTDFSGILNFNDNPPPGTRFFNIDGDAGDGDPGWTCAGAMPIACNSSAEVTLAAGGGSEMLIFRISIPEGFDPAAPGGILPPGAEGATRNCAHIDLAHHVDDPAGNNSDCDDFVLPPTGHDLTIEKTLNMCLEPFLGGERTCFFRVTISNVGDEDVTGVLRFTDYLPAGINYHGVRGDAGDGDPGWSCDVGPPTSCNSGAEVTLAAGGGSESLIITVRIPAGFEPAEPGPLLNCVQIDLMDFVGDPSGEVSDDDPHGNNGDCAAFEAEDDADAGGGTTCMRGRVCHPTAFIQNVGKKTLNRTAGIRGSLKSDIPIKSVTGPGWSCKVSGSSYECRPKALKIPPGQKDVLKLTLMIPKDFKPDSIRHEMSIVWPNKEKRDQNPQNDDDFSTIMIIGSLLKDLGVTKTGPAQCDAGGVCTYAITITNHGPGVFSGPLKVLDTVNGHASGWVTGRTPSDWVDGWDSLGWLCRYDSDDIYCKHAPVTLNPGSSLTFQINVEVSGVRYVPLQHRDELYVSNCARIYWPRHTARDHNPANDEVCIRTPVTVMPPPGLPSCLPGWKTFDNVNKIPREWQRRRMQGGKSIVWCARQVIMPPPPTTQCTPSNIQCYRGKARGNQCVCPTGSQKRQTGKCSWACKPLPTNQCTPSNIKCYRGKVKGNQCVCPARSQKRQTGKCSWACKPLPTNQCTSNNIKCYRGKVKGNQCICPTGSQKRSTGKCSWACKPLPTNQCTPNNIKCYRGKVKGNQCVCPVGSQKRSTGKCSWACKPVVQPQRIRCSGGSVKRGVCYCPGGYTRKTIGRNAYRCVKHRVTHRKCKPGHVWKNGRCIRYAPLHRLQRQQSGPH